MPVTNYATMDGVIVGETGPNGNLFYHTDALGSVTTVSDQIGDPLLELRYRPYGLILTHSGSIPYPKFTWVGSFGYRQTGRYHSDVYVRARHYSSAESRWTTVDQLWPSERAFNYASSYPTQLIDPSGRCSCTACSSSGSYSDSYSWVISPDFQATIDIDVTEKTSWTAQRDTSCNFKTYTQTNVTLDAWGVTDNDVGYLCVELGVLLGAVLITTDPVIGLAAGAALGVWCTQRTNAVSDCREARGKNSNGESLYHYKFSASTISKTSGNECSLTNCSRTSQSTTSCLGGQVLSKSTDSNTQCLFLSCPPNQITKKKP